MFSQRTGWELGLNQWALSLQRMRERGERILDLTESNPTRCGFRYLSPELLAPLTDANNLRYEPSPKGMLTAREAVATHYARRGIRVHPEHIFLTASTSEAYSFLFRLLCDPHDSVLIPQPSYPLFDYLATLSDVIPEPYRLVYDSDWRVDVAGLKRAIQLRPVSLRPETRAILLVNPNNPTGSFIKERELSLMNQVCEQHSLALIADEVFSDYAFSEGRDRVKSFATNEEALTFTLGGLSKGAGLPQMKLAWMVVSGPTELRAHAIARLEVIADTYLSVNTPSQNALAHWLQLVPGIQKEIMTRLLSNRGFLIEQTKRPHSQEQGVKYLASEGGWYAILRLPAHLDEEEFVLTLLEAEHLLVHPGYFFDFEKEGYIVLSLLPPNEVFKEGIERLLNSVN